MTLLDDATSRATDLAQLRHAFHQEPEVGLELPRTQRRILDALAGLPLEITLGERLTSITAVLRGGRPGPVVLLRADMDALPLLEAVDVPWRSRTDGAMHACGHDLHTTMLIGAAHLLAARREELPGTVLLMFQPGEEGHDGAGRMLDEGVLDAAGRRPVAAYAVHVFSSRGEPGGFSSRVGPLMAASDVFTATVHGAGGHGSAPQLARDPIPAACEMTLALQTMLTRTVDTFDPSVITVGSIHAGTAPNIIPDRAELQATVRTFSKEIQDRVAAGMQRLCQGIAAAHGLDVETVYDRVYPVTINDAAETAFVAETVGSLWSPDRFTELAHPITGAEDFSKVIAEVPGAMVFLGAMPPGSSGERRPDNHSPYASFEDRVLADGAALYAELAVRRLTAAASAGEESEKG
ncbi:MAG TPA: M20 family metallopeptidase [Acidimicrobiales bacterium]|nr:M20 family metallopeptidase [Acidimicrobiales bacterium]